MQEGWGGEERVQKEGMSELRIWEAEWASFLGRGEGAAVTAAEAGPGWVSLSLAAESRSR